MRSAHSSPYLTRRKPRTPNPLSQVGRIPHCSKQLRLTRGAAPSAKFTTPVTSAMAQLECVAASRDGATSSVAPQHAPVAADTAEVQSQVEVAQSQEVVG